jgi:hypothetical protein
MKSSVRAFFEGIIDYAGLFPPARLSMDEAVRNYLSYRIQPHAWMLGRFVCPASRLEEVLSLADRPLRTDSPIVIAAVGRSGATDSQFSDGLCADLDAIRAFGRRASAVIDSFEVRLPPESFAASDADLRQFFLRIIDLFESRDHSLSRYFEVPQGNDWHQSAERVIGLLSEIGHAQTGNGHWSKPGFKLRCGGLETAAIPSDDDVAFSLMRCRDHQVPFKATAGLHQALRHFDVQLKSQVHGFLNVFGAGVLAHARRLTEPQVRLLVADEVPKDFAFDEKGFHWRDLHTTSAEIALARKNLVLSFGSCSFEDPLEDLRNLGLLSR